jgi:beta-1,4-mannosyl-glycoprotein beta-1,4-N-acetylglucosaminyltransferase
MALEKRGNIQAGIIITVVTSLVGVVLLLLVRPNLLDASQGGVQKVSLPLTAVQHFDNNDNNDVRLFDCFLINTELDMLEFRLKTLDAVVDVFVLAEFNSTFSGNEKPLYFKDNMHRFSPYLHKISHIVIEDSPLEGSPWAREEYQRNALKRAFENVDPTLQDQDLIILSDVDEVPDPITLLTLKRQGYLRAVHAFSMDFYYYSKMASSWEKAKIVRGKIFQEDVMDFSTMRADNSADLPLRGGWHLSYIGGIEFIQNKLQSFSHQEYNNDQYTNADKISDSIENGKDLYGRVEITFVVVELKDNDYLPVHYEMLMNLTSVPGIPSSPPH